MSKTLHEVLESDEEITLVVQGGGMRGVYSVAALTEFFDMGYGDRFSEVIGTSAGALNGAYFLAGHPADGIFIYTQLLSGKRFINFTRYNKILDIDHLVDDIICGQVPLNEKALLESQSILWIALTSMQGKTVWKTQNEPWPISETLRAAAAMPIAYGRAVELGGIQYLDGGINESFGLSYALGRKPKNLLLILTRPIDYAKHTSSSLEKRIIDCLGKIAGHPKEVTKRISLPDKSFIETRRLLSSSSNNVWAIAPKENIIGRLTRQQDSLERAANVARSDVQNALLGK